MRTNSLKATIKTAIFALSILLLGSLGFGQTTNVTIAARPTTTTLPDGSVVPMWGYFCVSATALPGPNAPCKALNPSAGLSWSPVVITVPSGNDLHINLNNQLSFTPDGSSTPNNIPTSLVIVGQLGGGLGDVNQRTVTTSPLHDNQGTTWTAANAGGVFTPPKQGSRVQSFATEVAVGTPTGLDWKAPRPGTYLLESGTHPSIQGPMGLYGIVVVTSAPTTSGPGTAYPGVTYNSELPLIFSEIDPAQNNAVQKAVTTAGFVESATYGPWLGGPIATIAVTNGGSGYTVAPSVSFSGTGGGTAHAVIDTDSTSATFGQVTEIDIDNGGSYTSAPNVIISGGNPTTPATAIAALTLQANALSHCQVANGTAAACYPPVVNYSPLYYLINGIAFDKTAASKSLFASSPATGVSGNVLVRIVNAGLRMHVPAIVGSQTTDNGSGTATTVGGFSLIAEDGNALPGIPRVQSEVFMAAGKTYDVMINAPAAYLNAIPIYDRELSLSGNATSRDAGMLAYLSVNGGMLPNTGAFGATAKANPDTYNSLIDGKTLVVSDPAKGLLANDLNVYGVKVVGTTPTGLTLYANGTFTYTGAPTSFTYCGNNTTSGAACAVVTLGACADGTCKESAGGITLNDDSYTSTLASAIDVKSPGVLENDSDSLGYPLTVDTTSIQASSGLTVTADISGAFHASATAPGTYTFTYKAKNSQGTVSSASATVTLTFPKGSGLQVTLVDGISKQSLDPQDYRWIIEEDRTFYIDPKNVTNTTTDPNVGNSVPALGTNFHTSYMPVIAQGCTGDNSCEKGQMVLDTDPQSNTYGEHVPAVCDIGQGICHAGVTKSVIMPGDAVLDPKKRYYISVLPGDANDPGHMMGGTEVVADSTGVFQPVNILVEPTPVKPAKVSVFVYEDDYPLNGEQDSGGGIDVLAPNEPGLGNFNITLFDDVGQSGDSVGQITYDMFNEPLSNALAGTKDALTGMDACPISAQVTQNVTTGDGTQKGITGVIPVCPKYESDGKTLSPLAGQAVIANLPPGRYGVVATPGADRIARGEEWLQTNTLDGQKAHDSFIKVNEPSYFQEYGPAGYHVSIGFANPAIINSRAKGICAGITASDRTNTCTHTMTGKITGVHMSRTPDERLYSTGSRDVFSFTQCYVSLGSPDGADFAFSKCDANGNFTFSNVPAGDWRISVFDQWNDQIIDGYATPVTILNQAGTQNIGDVAVHQWKADLYTRTFLDLNGDGVSNRDSQGNDLEPGLPMVVTNVRYRDGSFSNLNSTDLNGYAAYNEVFPLFNWYVVETDTTRYKNTGTHVVYDVGGAVDTNGVGANLATTTERYPLPTDLRFPGSIYCVTADCSTESILNGPFYGGSSGDASAKSTGRIDPPYVETYGWQGFAGQGNFLEFGKKPFKEATATTPAENGGIRGDVVYASTRPFDNPALLLQPFWSPQVPHVTINLYQEGTAPDGTQSLKLVDTTVTSSWDGWAQGYRSDGKPNMNCPGQSPTDPFYFTIKGQQSYLDPTHTLPYDSQYKCYDGMHNWNQLQPAPYDGYYKFPSIVARDASSGLPTGTGSTNKVPGSLPGTNCTICIKNPDDNTPMLPSGKYVVEVVVPPGYELVKEEDKNILTGDAYDAPVTQEFNGFGNIFILPDQATVNEAYNPNNPQNPTNNLGAVPRREGDTGSVEEFWPCVGEQRIVPDYLSIFPQSQLVAPFAGAKRALCDRKEVALNDQMSALVKFYIFTSTHVASHLTGIISDDFTAEFDPFAPAFGEKFSPPNLPVSIKDWAGNEVNRVYSDQWGIYDGLTYSTWSVNPPDPSGFGPQVMVTCMNDRGTDTNPDPLFNAGYSQFCYELTFMPGTTFYADTPVVQTTAFADGYNHADCSYPDATPAVSEVDGDGTGPWVAGLHGTVTAVSLTNGGTGYTGTPAVHFAGGGGTGAAATAIVSGHVTTVNVTNGGRGYNSTATVTFGASPDGTTATGTAVMTGSVNSVTITSAGSGYTSNPTVTFSAPGNGGTTATGTALRLLGRIIGVNITNAGSGYSGTVTVSFSGGGGSGAAGRVNLAQSVKSVTITDPGSGYITAPSVTFNSPGFLGVRAQANSVILASVVAVNVTNGGSGYTAVPTVSFTGGGGSGAAATASVETGGTLTLTALGDQSIENNAYSGPSATTNPYNQKTITRHYDFYTDCTPANGVCSNGAKVTIGGVAAYVTEWTKTEIKVNVPAGIPLCTLQQQNEYRQNAQNYGQERCGELVITNANGKQSVDSITVTVGGKQPTVLQAGDTIQHAIDKAAPGDLIIVPKGRYSEMVLMWKPVRLQGVGAASSVINADPHPSGKLDPWRAQVSCLFGLAPNGQPYTDAKGSNPSPGCPADGWNYFNATPGVPQVDRIPFEAILSWDTTVNGNLAELLQEPSLMGAYEGAGITVLGKGVDTHNAADPFGQLNASGFPAGTTLLQNVAGLQGTTGQPYIDHCTDVPNPYPSNFMCNPSRIDGLTITNSSQGGGGIYAHAWTHNLEISNNRVQNNSGTLTGGITVGQGEFPDSYLVGGDQLDPWTCRDARRDPTGTQLPFCFDVNVNVHNNFVSQNAATGDELFSATPAGAGGVSFCSGVDYYKFNYNWVCGNLSNSDGGGFAQLGFNWHDTSDPNRGIQHNTIIFNQTTNPTVPTNGGGIMIMGAAPDGVIAGNAALECGNTAADADCPPGLSDGTGPGLLINGNLIQGNAADSGSGGGIRLQEVNGTEVSRFPRTSSQWYGVDITNNIIVNNVAGWDGGGIALSDSLKVNIVNNTIASNDSTAASGTLFQTFRRDLASAPPPNSIAGVCDSTTSSCQASQRQPAGISVSPNSGNMRASFTSAITCPADHPNCTSISNPVLYNNILWQNRSFHIELGGTPDPIFNQNVVTLVPTLNQHATGSCEDGAKYWDIGVRGDIYSANSNSAGHQSGYTLNPLYSVLTSASGYDVSNQGPSKTALALNSQYCNGSKAPPENGNTLAGYATPPGTDEGNVYSNHYFGLAPGGTVDESNNWIQVKWGPLAMVNPNDGQTSLGTYVPTSSSTAVDAVPGGQTTNTAALYSAIPSLSKDFFGNARPDRAGSSIDIGAVETTGSNYPSGSISPTSHAFGNTNVGSTSSSFTFTLSNSGEADLTYSITIPAPFARATGISAGTCSTSGTLAAPTGTNPRTCSIGVVFKPTSAGLATASLSVATNDRVHPTLTATLTGTGNGAAMSVSPSPLAFGNITTGQTATAAVTVTNTGTTTLSGGNSGVVTGAGFSRAGGTCGANLAAGNSCTVVVRFSPTAVTGYSGNLTVHFTQVANAVVTISGSGVSDQSTVAVSSPVTITLASGVTSGTGLVTLTNTSATANVSVTGVTVSGGSLFSTGYSFTKTTTGDTCTNSVIASGASCTVSVTFRTRNATTARIPNDAGTITFTDTATGSPQTGQLIGDAIE